MASLTIKPISFNSKTNEVIIDKEVFQWKKQKATLSKKKNTSAIEYLNLNYGNLINNNKGGVVFAYFDYNDNSTIYLMYSPNDKESSAKNTNTNNNNNNNNKLKTDLHFDLYIPSINSVEIVEETYDIETTDEKIIIYGKVYGFCVDNNTYYFKNIEINEYIEFVQRNNDTNEEDLSDKYDLEGEQDLENPTNKDKAENRENGEYSDTTDDEEQDDEDDEDIDNICKDDEKDDYEKD